MYSQVYLRLIPHNYIRVKEMMIKRSAMLVTEIYSDHASKTTLLLMKRPGLSWLFSKATFCLNFYFYFYADTSDVNPGLTAEWKLPQDKQQHV